MKMEPAEQLVRTLADLGPWAPLGFMGLFVVACLACVPVVFFTLAAGALFGLARGFLYTWLAALIGSSVAFFVSRYLARNWVTRHLEKRPWLWALGEAVSQEGWRIVVLARLAPGSPFFLLNYLFGLTKLRFRDYFLATAFSIIPGTLLFVYLGALGHMAVAGRSRTSWDWALQILGVAAVFVAAYLLARRAKALLHQRLEKSRGNDGAMR